MAPARATDFWHLGLPGQIAAAQLADGNRRHTDGAARKQPYGWIHALPGVPGYKLSHCLPRLADRSPARRVLDKRSREHDRAINA